MLYAGHLVSFTSNGNTEAGAVLRQHTPSAVGLMYIEGVRFNGHASVPH